MQSIKFQSHVGPDGILMFEVPVTQSDTDFEVMVIIQPIVVSSAAIAPITKTPEELGWPPGYFEQTEGSQEHDPIVRPPQSGYEVREELM